MQSATVRLDNPAHLLLGASLSPSTTNHPDRPPQQRLSNGARHACAGSAAGFAGAEEALPRKLRRRAAYSVRPAPPRRTFRSRQPCTMKKCAAPPPPPPAKYQPSSLATHARTASSQSTGSREVCRSCLSARRPRGSPQASPKLEAAAATALACACSCSLPPASGQLARANSTQQLYS